VGPRSGDGRPIPGMYLALYRGRSWINNVYSVSPDGGVRDGDV
jgi:hypothetical protein